MKFGWKPDRPDERDLKFSAPMAAVELPESASLREHVKQVFDQGPTNSCVAQAIAQAICVCESIAGLPLDTPSRRYVYKVGRTMTGDEDVDEGSYPREVFKALRNLGAPSEKYFTWKPSAINEAPTVHSHMMAHSRRGGTYRRILGTAPARLHGVRAAIAQKHPVFFGTAVTDAFCQAEGPDHIEAPGPSEPIVGHHAMLLVAYKPGWFLACNSWSRQWRAGGLAWLAEKYIAAAYTGDLTIVEGWARIREARAAKESA